jgi:phosphate-selective porin OprO/OprP
MGASARRYGVIFAALLACLQPVAVAAETSSHDDSIDDTLNAAEAEGVVPKSEGKPWNMYDGRLITLGLGGGFLVDYADYIQNEASKTQMPQSADIRLRDFRILLKGKFKFLPGVSYSLGYMYDGVENQWLFRQTGIMVDIPALDGNLFVGRTKEGFSTSKIMVGYYGWGLERSAANDAFLPILADGIKWTGRGFGNKLVYNMGGYFEKLGGYQNYDKNDEIAAARAVWLPFAKTDKVLHVAFEGRYGTAKDGNLQFRSKPESFPAQSYAVDTGKFLASSNAIFGFETYYRPGPLMFGLEYYVNKVYSSPKQNPLFHGGEIFAAYTLTGEIRPYDEKGAFFEAISPLRPVFKGGPGAWELVARASYVDLDSKLIDGGRFWRLTPVVNWHLSDNARLEFAYGYSILDRFGLVGATHYFQTRLQLTLM